MWQAGKHPSSEYVSIYIYTDIHITRAQANSKESLVRSRSEL